jgi:hypothetical protein
MATVVVRVVLALLLLCSSAFARGGGGGRVTQWDPNIEGGGWVCFGAQVTGCSQGFNATCSPSGASGSDAAALNSFNTFFSAQTSPVKLYIAPGMVCHTEGSTNNFGWGTQSLIIWAYGASVSNGNFGGQDLFHDTVHSAKFATVSAGASSVSLITPSEISRFTNGDTVLIGGISLQTFGYPPNLQLHEWKVITAITTNCPSPCTSSTITVNGTLANGYKSTWPDLGSIGGDTPLGGPGTIYDIDPHFNGVLDIRGLIVRKDINTPTNGANVVNKTTYFLDVIHRGGGWGFRGQNITLVGTGLPGSTEFDKNIENVNCYVCIATGNGLFFANASPTYLNVMSSYSNSALNGSGQNATVVNSNFQSIAAGVAGYGGASTFTVIDTTFPDAHTYYQFIPTTDLTFSSGTFTILKAAGTIANAYATFQPGFKYYLGGAVGNTVCTPKAEFTVTDLREDATHVFIDIDQSTLPTCTGGPVLSYGQFHALTASQVRSGPANIFSIPEMVP